MRRIGLAVAALMIMALGSGSAMADGHRGHGHHGRHGHGHGHHGHGHAHVDYGHRAYYAPYRAYPVYRHYDDCGPRYGHGGYGYYPQSGFSIATPGFSFYIAR